MINFDNGYISIGTTTIFPGMKYSDFKATSQGKKSVKVMSDRIYTSQKIMPCDFYGRGVCFLFIFRHNKLVSFQISLLDGMAETWSELTQENELKQKKKHDNLVFEITGQRPTVHYKWGDIYSIYDGKSIASFIDVIYK